MASGRAGEVHMGLVPLPRHVTPPRGNTHTRYSAFARLSDEKHADRIACDNSRVRG